MESIFVKRLENIEYQSFLEVIEPQFLLNRKYSILIENDNKKKRRYKGFLAMPDSTQQVYLPPKIMVVFSEKGIEPLLFQRPIDKVFEYFFRENESELFGLFPVYELVVMHLQLAAEEFGVYWVVEGGIPRMFPLRTGLRKRVIASLYKILEKAEKSETSSHIPMKAHSEILPETSSSKLGIHLQRGSEAESKISEALVLYLSRILRPIWSADFKEAFQLTDIVLEKLDMLIDFMKEEESRLLFHDSSKISEIASKAKESLKLLQFFKERNLTFPLQFSDFMNADESKLLIIQGGFTQALKMDFNKFQNVSEFCNKNFPHFYSEVEETVCACEILLNKAFWEKQRRVQIFNESQNGNR